MFHIHLGYKNPNVRDSLTFLRYFDEYVGIPSVLHDPDTRRRSLYGKAGSFRLTSYGVEARLLSSAMMATPELLSIVWNGIRNAIHACNTNERLISSNTVRSIIDNSDVERAKKYCSEYNLLKPYKEETPLTAAQFFEMIDQANNVVVGDNGIRPAHIEVNNF